MTLKEGKRMRITLLCMIGFFCLTNHMISQGQNYKDNKEIELVRGGSS